MVCSFMDNDGLSQAWLLIVFNRFRQKCETAFLELRKKGDLFINLFCMMLSTGIPELRSIDDISYIREALCLGETEQVREFPLLLVCSW